MTREEFIKVLDDSEYSYEIQGDKIIVTEGGDVDLEALTSLPPGVEFRNRGNVWLNYLTSLPPGVEFRNGGFVHLDSLTSLPPGIVFNNEGSVRLRALIGGLFNEWNGNIEGIDSKRLLNFMISKELFER